MMEWEKIKVLNVNSHTWIKKIAYFGRADMERLDLEEFQMNQI